MPGVDQVFLAMDSDDGVEVEWNEVYYTPSKFISTPEELAVHTCSFNIFPIRNSFAIIKIS